MSDIYNDDNAVKSSWMKWGKPGNSVMGTLMSKEERENEYNGKKEMQTIYELKVISGEFNDLSQDENGNYVAAEELTTMTAGDIYNIGGKAAIDSQMRNIKIGQIVALKFMESVPAKKKGNYPTKVVKVYTEGKMDEEYLTGLNAEVKEGDKDW